MRQPDYERGSVRLFHGDCLEILPELEPGSIDCVFMDPPYGHNNNNNDDLIARWEVALGKQEHAEVARPIANDGAEANELVRAVFAECKRILAPGCCCCCCCGGGGPDPQFARWSLWIDEAIGFKQMVVWDKGPMGMGWHYRRSYETVLVAQKRGAACRWYDESSAIENVLRHGDYGIRKIIPSANQHPTEKPPELAAHFIRLHSERGQTVCDPFAGVASTGVACVRLGRKFVGIEIERRWFDVAVRRIDAAFNETALLDGEWRKPVQGDLPLELEAKP